MAILGQFQFRRDTATNWSSVNPILLDGELGIESDTDKFKLGDGVTAWNALPYGGIKGDTGAAGATPNAFTNIAVTGQNTVVADQANDTLTLVAGTNITIVTDDATDSITINSTSVETNAFGIVTGNTGTATADLPTDTLAITGGTGISTDATDTPDGLVITNTDTGSAARTAHEAAADPHPQYLTQTEANALYQPAGAGPSMSAVVLSATQASTTTTLATLNGMTFTVPPGKTISIQGNLIFTAAATTTGAFYGFSATHGAGANGNLQGSWIAEVAITSASAASGLRDGDAINLAAGATTSAGVLGTATVAGNNSASISLTAINRSTNVNATISIQFSSEVAGSAVTAQIGTSAVAIIG